MGFAMRRVIQNTQSLTHLHPEVVRIMEKANSFGIDIHLPMDYVTYSQVGDYVEATLPGVFEMDCGPVTQAFNTMIIKASKTIIWNGPIGVYEIDRFAVGTKHMMHDVINATKLGASSLIVGRHTNRMFDLHDCGFEVTHATKWSGPVFNILFGIQLMAIAALSVAPATATGMHISIVCVIFLKYTFLAFLNVHSKC